MRKKYRKEQLASILAEGNIRIVTNHGEIDLRNLPHICKNNESVYETSFAKVFVSVYEKGGDTVYRSLKLLCKKEGVNYSVSMGNKSFR